MVLYEVTVEMQLEHAGRYEAYMREKHVPDIFATGCFVDAAFCVTGPGRFKTVYRAADQAALDRYLAQHAPAFRADFANHFPAGAAVSREIWRTLQTWGGTPP